MKSFISSEIDKPQLFTDSVHVDVCSRLSRRFDSITLVMINVPTTQYYIAPPAARSDAHTNCTHNQIAVPIETPDQH
jgi:hypothetical protein